MNLFQQMCGRPENDKKIRYRRSAYVREFSIIISTQSPLGVVLLSEYLSLVWFTNESIRTKILIFMNPLRRKTSFPIQFIHSFSMNCRSRVLKLRLISHMNKFSPSTSRNRVNAITERLRILYTGIRLRLVLFRTYD